MPSAPFSFLKLSFPEYQAKSLIYKYLTAKSLFIKDQFDILPKFMILHDRLSHYLS